jgi:hypothetical protein
MSGTVMSKAELYEASITIESICRKVIKGAVLDVFYIIAESDEISLKEIGNKFIEETLVGDDLIDIEPRKSQKLRPLVNECIAKLEGATLIHFYKAGIYHNYSLTPNGLIAKEIIADLLDEDPTITMGSKYVKKLMS